MRSGEERFTPEVNAVTPAAHADVPASPPSAPGHPPDAWWLGRRWAWVGARDHPDRGRRCRLTMGTCAALRRAPPSPAKSCNPPSPRMTSVCLITTAGLSRSPACAEKPWH